MMVYLTDDEQYLFHGNRYWSELETWEPYIKLEGVGTEGWVFSYLLFFTLKSFQKSWISLCMQAETKDEKQRKPVLQ